MEIDLFRYSSSTFVRCAAVFLALVGGCVWLMSCKANVILIFFLCPLKLLVACELRFFQRSSHSSLELATDIHIRWLWIRACLAHI